MKILEVCTESSPAYALVFSRAHKLNQSYPGIFDIDMLCNDGKEVDLMRKQGMKVIISPLHRSLNPLRLTQSARNLLQVIRKNDYDVIHLHFGVPSLVGRCLAIFFRKPIWIYQSHGYSIAHNTSALNKIVYLGLEKALKKTVEIALFQSREDIEMARRHQLLAETQIVYLGNGIDTQRFKPANELPDNDELFVFGMVARFEGIKNHQLLIDAVKHLRLRTQNFRVLLIGQGDLSDMIAAQIAAHELYDQVKMLPYRHDMPAFYQSIDMGVLTSFGEGLPRALLEPMASGKAVLCTDVKGSREAVINNKTGFILALDAPEQWAEKMHWCINHKNAVKSMGRAARQHVLHHYSEQQVIDRLADVYLKYGAEPDDPATEATP